MANVYGLGVWWTFHVLDHSLFANVEGLMNLPKSVSSSLANYSLLLQSELFERIIIDWY